MIYLFKFYSLSAVDGQFVDHIKVLYHFGELVEGDLAVLVGVCLYYGSVNELLQLNVVQVVTNHHFEHLEELTVRNVPVVVDIVDLESESQFLFIC